MRQIVYSESGRGVHTVMVDGNVVVDGGRIVTVDYAALLDEVAELGEIYAADSRNHGERLKAATPYLAEVVCKHSDKPLDFDRWLAASDRLENDAS